jgi:hypothetical protein
MIDSRMVTIRYDSNGGIKDGPISLSPGDDLTFELISDQLELDNADDCELTLALEKPVAISAGEIKFTWGGDSTSYIPAAECTPYAIERALNSLAAIISADGVVVSSSGEANNIGVSFSAVGSRANFTITHSVLGDLTGRSSVILAGSGSLCAHFRFDLSVQTLAKTITPTDLTGATFTVSNIVTGTSLLAQRDKVTLSRSPEYGKWQIWTGASTATRWLTTTASAYDVEAALEDVATGAFMVSRDTMGERVVWDVTRSAVGVNTAITVKTTAIGPVGVSMELDLANVLNLLQVVGAEPPISALLTFRHESVTQFSQLIDLSPILHSQAQPL